MKLTWNDIARKLTSRKFWAAIIGTAAGLFIALGGDASEVETIAGLVTTLATTISYIVAEAYVDGKKKASEAVNEVVDVELPEGSE